MYRFDPDTFIAYVGQFVAGRYTTYNIVELLRMSEMAPSYPCTPYIGSYILMLQCISRGINVVAAANEPSVTVLHSASPRPD